MNGSSWRLTETAWRATIQWTSRLDRRRRQQYRQQRRQNFENDQQLLSLPAAPVLCVVAACSRTGWRAGAARSLDFPLERLRSQRNKFMYTSENWNHIYLDNHTRMLFCRKSKYRHNGPFCYSHYKWFLRNVMYKCNATSASMWKNSRSAKILPKWPVQMCLTDGVKCEVWTYF